VEFPTGKAIDYRYDELDQLVEEELPDGTKIEYTYDGFGNRTKVVKTKVGSRRRQMPIITRPISLFGLAVKRSRTMPTATD